jgi:hypothetical protein
VNGCTKHDAHRSLSFELDILLEGLPVDSRGYSKAVTLRKSLEVSAFFLSYFIIGATLPCPAVVIERFFAQGKMFFARSGKYIMVWASRLHYNMRR